MGAFARIRTGVGIVALAATFALASPGVRTVRAEEAVAGQCSTGQPTSSDAETQAFLRACGGSSSPGSAPRASVRPS